MSLAAHTSVQRRHDRPSWLDSYVSGSHPIDVNHVQPVEQVGIERAV